MAIAVRMLMLCTLVGCGLTDTPTPDIPVDDTLFFTGFVNGDAFAGVAPVSGISPGPDFSVSASDPAEQRYPYERSIYFSIPIESIGTYSLNRTTRISNEGTGSAMFHLYGIGMQESYGDQVNSEFRPVVEEVNRLVVTRYDGVGGYAEGTFEATLVVDFSSRSRELPDTLRITDGRFRTRIRDYQNE